jgi:pilus assembly protein CpaE
MTVRAQLAGDWSGLTDLRDALARSPELALEGGDPDVVLFAGRDAAAGRFAAPVVLLAPAGSPALLEQALAAGVSDVIVAPHAREAVLFAAAKAARSPRPARASEPGRVVTVFSPKGGTGKSVTASNLAAALAVAGCSTLLVDLDLQFGDCAILLGLEPRTTLRELAGPGDLDAEKLTGSATVHASGLHVVPAPLKPEDGEVVPDDAVARLLDVARRTYTAVVVDTSPSFHGPVLAAVDRTDELLLLCTPDVATLKNVRLALGTLALLEFPAERIRLVLNRASARDGFGAREVGAVLGRPIDHELPVDPAASIGANAGRPAATTDRDAPFSRALLALLGELFPSLRPAPAAPSRFPLMARASAWV